MHFLEQLSLASALISLVHSSPVEKRKVTFTVHQSVPKAFVRSGPAAVAAVYEKYGATAPADVVAAAAANDGSVTTTPEQNDVEYLTPVTIGGQTLNLDFDTGSSDLWVYSSELSATSQSGHDVYDPTKSTTSKVLPGYTWSIQYGDGSGASGNVYTDTVKVGTTTVANQAVELAQTVSAQFQRDVDNDGLLGLGFDSLNTVKPTQQRTFFSNAKSSLSAPLFTANLKKGAPGSYDFGFIDSTKYTGAITYVNVNTARGWWQFTANGYAVGTGAFTSTSLTLIADTGTTLIYLPSAIVSAYYARITGARYDSTQGGYVYPCSSVAPSFTLGIGSYRAVVPGNYITYVPISSTTCFGGIQRNDGLPVSILGDIFLKSQFVVFNGAATPQLGFAKKAT